MAEAHFQLWTRARGGDPAARAQLAQLALETARRELAARGAPFSSIEDLSQDAVRQTLAFLAASAEEPRELSAFLKWRAFGVLSDWRKRQRRDPMHRGAATAADELQDSSSERASPAVELRDALADCRARLSAADRDLLVARYERGSDAGLLAQELGISRNAVHIRAFRALERLRECLERKGWSAEDLST